MLRNEYGKTRIDHAMALLKNPWPISSLASLTALTLACPVGSLASALDHLTDLSGKAQVIVTFKGRDNFTSEYRYDVTVKNQTADPLIGDTLVVVLDKITNLAGEEREPLKSETILSRFDVLGQDTETSEGKPIFHVPVEGAQDLLPQTESRPVFVRLRNKDYISYFTPVFKVYGTKRPPPKPEAPDAVPRQADQFQAKQEMDSLIQLLIKKGVITEEEWKKANQP
jgi:hypothetical protein